MWPTTQEARRPGNHHGKDRGRAKIKTNKCNERTSWQPIKRITNVATLVRRILDAARFAAEKHAQQKRKGENGEPYFNHLLEVAELIAASSPHLDVELVMAAFCMTQWRIPASRCRNWNSALEKMLPIWWRRSRTINRCQRDQKAITSGARPRNPRARKHSNWPIRFQISVPSSPARQ